MQRCAVVMITSLVFSLFACNISGAYEREIKGLSTSLAESIVTSGRKSVAVVDFTDLQGNVTELGRFLAEEFSVALSESGKSFEVVDRTYLKTLLKEHELGQTGLIDPKTAQKLGEIAGVQGLITGTLTPFGDSIRVSVKVLDTTTAKVIGASRGDIPKTKAIEELLAKGIESPPVVGSQERRTVSVPPPSSPTSRIMGDIIVTLKRVMVLSDGMVIATLDVFNQQDERLKLAKDDTNPTLSDEKGNSFTFSRGVGF